MCKMEMIPPRQGVVSMYRWLGKLQSAIQMWEKCSHVLQDRLLFIYLVSRPVAPRHNLVLILHKVFTLLS